MQIDLREGADREPFDIDALDGGLMSPSDERPDARLHGPDPLLELSDAVSDVLSDAAGAPDTPSAPGLGQADARFSDGTAPDTARPARALVAEVVETAEAPLDATLSAAQESPRDSGVALAPRPEPDQAPDPDSAAPDLELPVWDPTGRHTLGQPVAPAGRRMSFADILGFGIDTDETVTTHEHDALATPGSDQSEMPGWDTLPQLADVATADSVPTNDLVQRLWDATAEQPVPVADHESQLAPFDFQEMFRSNRTFRWSVVAGAVAVLFVALLTMRAIGQRPVTIAEERAVVYEETAQRLTAALTGFDATSRTITNPTTTTDELSVLTGDLLSVGSLAHDLAETAAEPLPEPSLLGASGPIDRLASPQELLQQAAERALTVERRLGDALSYRVLIEQAFVTGDLPVAAREGDLGDIGAELSVVEATSEQVLDRLPGDAFFATYAASAESLLEEFRDWQVDYLASLRDGDVAEAGVLRRDWQSSVSAFRAQLATPLMAVDTWASEELVHLRSVLELALERLQ